MHCATKKIARRPKYVLTWKEEKANLKQLSAEVESIDEDDDEELSVPPFRVDVSQPERVSDPCRLVLVKKK